MRTEFGDYLWDLRRKNDEILYNMAKRLNVGCAYLSGVENGRSPIKKELVDNIINTYDLGYYEKLILLSSANMSNIKNGYKEVIEMDIYDIYPESIVNFAIKLKEKDNEISK